MTFQRVGGSSVTWKRERRPCAAGPVPSVTDLGYGFATLPSPKVRAVVTIQLHHQSQTILDDNSRETQMRQGIRNYLHRVSYLPAKALDFTATLHGQAQPLHCATSFRNSTCVHGSLLTYFRFGRNPGVQFLVSYNGGLRVNYPRRGLVRVQLLRRAGDRLGFEDTKYLRSARHAAVRRCLGRHRKSSVAKPLTDGRIRTVFGGEALYGRAGCCVTSNTFESRRTTVYSQERPRHVKSLVRSHLWLGRKVLDTLFTY
jgi:hypothetical protein